MKDFYPEKTPLPWKAHEADVESDHADRLNARSLVADCNDHAPYTIDKEGEANAAFIVLAANSHGALVKSLEALIESLSTCLKDEFSIDPEKDSDIIEARAALALARPKESEVPNG